MTGTRHGLPFALLLVGLGLGWWLGREQPRSRGEAPSGAGTKGMKADPPPAAASSVSVDAGPGVEREEAEPIVAAEEARIPTTARDFLRDYGGARWPTIEAELTRRGLDLDVPFQPAPWESVADSLGPLVALDEGERSMHARNFMEWPDSNDEEGLREWISRRSDALAGVELDSATLAEVAAVVRPFNEELAPLAEEYVSVLDRHLKERWARGDFEKAPFSSYGVHTRQGFAFKGFVRDGWAVALTLEREDCPDAVALLERAGVIRRRRDAALHAAFAGR